MTLKGIVAGIFGLLTFATVAQDWSSDKYQYDELYDGYVVDNEGNKLEGVIKYRNRFIMQEEVVFFKSRTDERSKQLFKPTDIIEYYVADKHYYSLPYAGKSSIDQTFLLVTQSEGCIKEYIHYDRASGYKSLIQRPGESDEDYGDRKFPSSVVYFKRGDERTVDSDYFKEDFAKRMKDYLETNKELAKKVKSGASGYDKVQHIRAIFKEYNEGC